MDIWLPPPPFLLSMWLLYDPLPQIGLKLRNCIYPFLQLGYPLPKLVWYTSDSEQGGIVTIADSSYDTLGGATRNTLSIARLERSHFGQTFSCQAMNNNVTDPVTTNVTIDMRRKFFPLL